MNLKFELKMIKSLTCFNEFVIDFMKIKRKGKCSIANKFYILDLKASEPK